PEQVALRSHGADLRTPEESITKRWMVRSKPPWHEKIDRPAQQFLARVPEQPLDLLVDQHDLSRAVDHQHAARRRFDHGAKPRLETALGRGVGVHGRNTVESGGETLQMPGAPAKVTRKTACYIGSARSLSPPAQARCR